MNIKYNNPDDNWYYNQRYDRKASDNMRGCFYGFIFAILCIILSLLFSSCKSIQYVPVEKVKIEYRNRTDTVTKIDSIKSEKEIIIREADSSLVASLGLKLKDNERAILILQRQLEREINKEKEHIIDTIIKIDSIQVPYPVEKKLSNWEKIKIDYGGISISLFLVIVGFLLYRLVVVRK